MKFLPAAALALMASAPAFASSSFSVDFERNWDYLNGDVNGYYAGGMAADGSSGTNLGVSFVNVSGLSNAAPDFVYYSGAPSPLGIAYAHAFTADDHAYMNVAGGVAGALSFFYASTDAVAGAVRAYSGLNGTGTLLGSFDVLANGRSGFDVWTASTFSFAGTALSFDLTNSANLVGFDNFSAIAAPVPEPSTVLLMLAGGVAVLRQATRRSRRKAA